ncbi:MAG: hypothetical protein E7289_00460 [Lachnospiraceae bacterium]|nr:hypothetical protein [Lachnospiraceae bacterium]
MRRLLGADLQRMYHNKKIWIALFSMLLVAGMFVVMQYTAMDYEVPLSRVIFLPMTFYGLAAAAFIGFYVGEDFSEGTVRNKIIAGSRRSDIYMSHMICVWTAGLLLFALTTFLTVSVSLPLFESDVAGAEVAMYFGLGCLTVLAMGSVFCMISMGIGNRSVAVTVCMGLAFVMLFLCLHTNQIIAQQPLKNGVLNPHYVDGWKRMFYEWLHDVNPMGQIAQLSEMKYLNPLRWIVLDVIWMFVSLGAGSIVFVKKDIR